MKKVLEVITGAAFIAALFIVGAVEHGADIKLMWWTVPAIAIMAAAALLEDRARTKKFFEEGIF